MSYTWDNMTADYGLNTGQFGDINMSEVLISTNERLSRDTIYSFAERPSEQEDFHGQGTTFHKSRRTNSHVSGNNNRDPFHDSHSLHGPATLSIKAENNNPEDMLKACKFLNFVENRQPEKSLCDPLPSLIYEKSCDGLETNQGCLGLSSNREFERRDKDKKFVSQPNEESAAIAYDSDPETVCDEEPSCTFCSKKFADSITLQCHMKACNSGDSMKAIEDGDKQIISEVSCQEIDQFVCKICPNLTFITAKHLDRHVRYVHSCGGTKSTCPNCGRVFSRKAALEKHLHTHSDFRPFACSYCDKTFRSALSLRNHEYVHTGNQSFTCSSCGKRFYSENLLRKHEFIHTEKRPHPCTECKKTFKVFGQLLMHLRMHAGIRKHQCDQCGKRFMDKRHLRLHYTIHTGELPFECLKCGKKFRDKTVLKTHDDTVHLGKKPFNCDECGMSFSSKIALAVHQRKHTGELPYQCNVCGKAYGLPNSLEVHLRTHTGDRPFPCTECDKTFTTDWNMRNHMKTHTGARPYSCDQCDKKFASSSNLYVHKQWHNGKKSFTCSKCGRGFTWSSHLEKHFKLCGTSLEIRNNGREENKSERTSENFKDAEERPSKAVKKRKVQRIKLNSTSTESTEETEAINDKKGPQKRLTQRTKDLLKL